ncbi:MAG: hypothetical protein IKB59_01295 [Alphaproteobacteria bacterium]|nr:hypothetical protein [Alphaproteobacteria bacterium]
MTKVIRIIENNCITGVQYGVVEFPDTPVYTKHLNTNKQKVMNKRYIKQLQNTRIRQK